MDAQGRVIDVVLDYTDYRTLIKVISETADWERLPAYLQDEVDALLIEEAKAEQGDQPLTPIEEVLADLEARRENAA
jgi:hypothetical protein